MFQPPVCNVEFTDARLTVDGEEVAVGADHDERRLVVNTNADLSDIVAGAHEAGWVAAIRYIHSLRFRGPDRLRSAS